jgi:hypothetical protein
MNSGSNEIYRLPKTGQTTSYATGDDGYYKIGITSPNPRFTLIGELCVYDNLTELMWTKNANLFGQETWAIALWNCNDLDYAGYTDWRLPNRLELLSLVDRENHSPSLPTGHPFANVQNNSYHTSTLVPGTTYPNQFVVYFTNGVSSTSGIWLNEYYWPVRST